MRVAQDQIEGLPPGAILKPIQPQADTSGIEGLPAGAILKPISQPIITTSAGEVLPADVAARHARSREGKDINYGQPGGETGPTGVAAGVGKAGLETVQGLTKGANWAARKLDPLSSPESPTPQIPIPAQSLDTKTQGLAEGIGGFGENVLEFMSGEELLSGLSKVAKFEKLAQSSPTVANVLSKTPSIVKKVFSGAAKAGVIGGAQGAVHGGAESGAAGGAIGGAAGEVVPVVTQKLGSILEKYAPDFMNSLMRAKKGNFLYAKNPGQAIIDEGINAPKSLTLAGQLENIHGQLETAGENLDTQIKQTLNQPKVAAIKQDIVPFIKDTIEAAKQRVVNEPGLDTKAYLSELSQLEENILTKYNIAGESVGQKFSEPLSPSEISDVKKSIGKSTQWKVFPTDPQYKLKSEINKVRQQIYGGLKEMVENAAEQRAPGSDIGALNARYANVIEAQGLLENRIAQEHGSGGENAWRRKKEWATGLGLIFSGHPYLMATGAGVLANRISRTVPVRVLESRAGSAAGRAMQSHAAAEAAEKVLPTVGAQAGQWVRMQLSDGSSIEAHPEDVDKVQGRDPGARIIQ